MGMFSVCPEAVSQRVTNQRQDISSPDADQRTRASLFVQTIITNQIIKTMKRFNMFAASLLLMAGAAHADGETVILDLTKATTHLDFNSDNGSWTETFTEEDAPSINSQCFSFLHYGMETFWWGFTASVSADNSKPANTIEQQWSNMASGGIMLDDNGEVKKDEFGAPVVSSEVPYIVGYYSAYMSRRPNDMVFNDGKCYDPVGVYVNLNSYAYYSIVEGDGYARAFTNGDKFTLTIHGVAPDESEKTVDVSLASYSNGDLTVSRGWKYVDLTELGTVNELYFTLESTDSGVYGMNTPGYFCLDKLSVKPAANSGVENISGEAETTITYNQNTAKLRVNGAEFAVVCNAAGQIILSGEQNEFDLSSLPAGVYIAKAGNKVIKFAR